MNDGSVLCDLFNSLPVGPPLSVARPRFGMTLSAFQSKKNIDCFLDNCNEALGFDYESMFETDELFLGTRFERVVQTISMVSHTSQAKSLGVPAFPEGGVKEDIYGGFGDEEEEEEDSIYGDLDQAVGAKITSHRQRAATVSASAASAIAAHSGGGGGGGGGGDDGGESSDDGASMTKPFLNSAVAHCAL